MSIQANYGPAPACFFSLIFCLLFPHIYAPQPLSPGTTDTLLDVASFCLCCLSCIECLSPSLLLATLGLSFMTQLKNHLLWETIFDLFFLTGRMNHFFSEEKKHFLHDSVFCFVLFHLRFCLVISAQAF